MCQTKTNGLQGRRFVTRLFLLFVTFWLPVYPLGLASRGWFANSNSIMCAPVPHEISRTRLKQITHAVFTTHLLHGHTGKPRQNTQRKDSSTKSAPASGSAHWQQHREREREREKQKEQNEGRTNQPKKERHNKKQPHPVPCAATTARLAGLDRPSSPNCLPFVTELPGC